MVLQAYSAYPKSMFQMEPLTDDGGGEITITTGGGGGGTPGGTNGQIQFNDNGSFGGVTAVGVANGGTGATSLTDGGVLLGSGTGAITATAVLTNGQLLIGDGTGDPTVATLTAGTGITITNGAGSITIASSVSGTVTSVASGENLTGGPITTTGTISLELQTLTPAVGPGGLPEGFAGPPPDDAGKQAYGWARVTTVEGEKFIALWESA
jgi:hypothetical protein